MSSHTQCCSTSRQVVTNFALNLEPKKVDRHVQLMKVRDAWAYRGPNMGWQSRHPDQNVPHIPHSDQCFPSLVFAAFYHTEIYKAP